MAEQGRRYFTKYMADKSSLEKLLEVGAHFGHQKKRWNPKMGEYIYGVKEGISIFDLVKTKAALEEALVFLTTAAKDKKLILFVGTKRQGRDKLVEVAKSLGAPYVDERWLGGTLTNFSQIRDSVENLDKMIDARQKGEYNEYTKKERLLIDRDIEKLEKKVGGLRLLNRVPDVMFILDTHQERAAVREAIACKVETVGIVDSNADPDDVQWPIPMNDDASAALEYVLDLVHGALSVAPKAAPVEPAKKLASKKAAKPAAKAKTEPKKAATKKTNKKTK